MKISRALPVILATILIACGGTEAGQTAASVGPAETVATVPAVDTEDLPAPEEAEEAIEDMNDDLQEQQDAQGGGSATLTVGDTTWDFASVLCAFGPDEIGQEGAEFVLSALQDGLQLYVSVDSFGHSVSLNDIADFENPSVSLTADSMTGGSEEFVVVDGKTITAEASFVNYDSDNLDPIAGTLEATCP